MFNFVKSIKLYSLQLTKNNTTLNYKTMKTSKNFCTAKCEYLRPNVEFTDIAIERGFAVTGNIEDVGKDEEVDFY